MKTIDLSGGTHGLDDLLRLASEEGLLLRTEDGKEFVLAEVDDLEHEVALIRENPELMAFLDERFKPEKSFTEDQVREILGLD